MSVDSWLTILTGLGRRTHYHDIEIKPLPHTLAVPLVGQVGESNVSSQFSPNNIPHVTGSLSCSLRVPRADSLGGDLSLRNWIVSLRIGGGRFAVGHGGALRWNWRTSCGWGR